MNYKEQINTGISELVASALDVQNKGLATVFVDVSGHVNNTVVRFHVPEWNENNTDATLRLDFKNEPESIKKAKSELQAFILAIPEIQAEKVKQDLEAKIKLVEQLTAEIAAA